MKKRLITGFVLVAFVILMWVTLYRFIDNLDDSHKQLGQQNERNNCSNSGMPTLFR
ncbi:hypothetical protein [Paenibacillus faecalis]|uniref:hypothetical protein n=1 Tax=Paenibacillus faecalis TaxID=2079532 RepID=UPI00131A5512|nr:hypothetical protein [Paenibacillus faecalis]